MPKRVYCFNCPGCGTHITIEAESDHEPIAVHLQFGLSATEEQTSGVRVHDKPDPREDASED
jgi:hypothetical protein